MDTTVCMDGGFEASGRAFLQQVARQRVTTYDGMTWAYFDSGRRGNASGVDLPPLVCLPGASGTAQSFHWQIQALAAKGYRVISVCFALPPLDARISDIFELKRPNCVLLVMVVVSTGPVPGRLDTKSGCRASTGSSTRST